MASNQEKIINHLKKLKYNDNAIAAIMANIDVETGGTFSYRQKQRGGAGYGLFQFDFMKKYYFDYLKKNNKKDSIESQIDYMDDVINNRVNMLKPSDAKKLKDSLSQDDKGTKASIKKVTKQMTLDFQNIFEKPGKPHTERRLKSADKLRDSLSQKTFMESSMAGGDQESMRDAMQAAFADQQSQDAFMDVMSNSNLDQRDKFLKDIYGDLNLEELGGPWNRVTSSIGATTKFGIVEAQAEAIISEDRRFEEPDVRYGIKYRNGGFSAEMFRQGEKDTIKASFRKKF